MGASERLYHSQGRECGLGGLPGKRSRDWRKVCTPVFYVAAEDSNESSRPEAARGDCHV
jgi:hypothetical protein